MLVVDARDDVTRVSTPRFCMHLATRITIGDLPRDQLEHFLPVSELWALIVHPDSKSGLGLSAVVSPKPLGSLSKALGNPPRSLLPPGPAMIVVRTPGATPADNLATCTLNVLGTAMPRRRRPLLRD